jgi:hypothetical protein
MSEQPHRRISFLAKMVIVMAVSFLVGIGMCGLSIAVASSGFQSDQEFGGDKFGIGTISILVMAFSLVGLVLSLIAWGIAAVMGSASDRTGEK